MRSNCRTSLKMRKYSAGMATIAMECLSILVSTSSNQSFKMHPSHNQLAIIAMYYCIWKKTKWFLNRAQFSTALKLFFLEMTSLTLTSSNIFNGNDFSDLYLRGYDEEDLYHNYSADAIWNLLKKCLIIGREILMIWNALTIEFRARKTQFVEVDHAIPCNPMHPSCKQPHSRETVTNDACNRE